jgi:hypothetical protein
VVAAPSKGVHQSVPIGDTLGLRPNPRFHNDASVLFGNRKAALCRFLAPFVDRLARVGQSSGVDSFFCALPLERVPQLHMVRARRAFLPCRATHASGRIGSGLLPARLGPPAGSSPHPAPQPALES